MNTVYLNQRKFWNNYNGNATPGAAAPIFKKLGKWVFFIGIKTNASYDFRAKLIPNQLLYQLSYRDTKSFLVENIKLSKSNKGYSPYFSN